MPVEWFAQGARLGPPLLTNSANSPSVQHKTPLNTLRTVVSVEWTLHKPLRRMLRLLRKSKIVVANFAGLNIWK